MHPVRPAPARYARLLENPIVSVCTHMLLDATGPSHGIMLPVPELWRTACFRDLHFCFPGGDCRALLHLPSISVYTALQGPAFLLPRKAMCGS